MIDRMTVNEYANYLHITRQAVYKQIKSGKLQTVVDTSGNKSITYILVDRQQVDKQVGQQVDNERDVVIATLREQLVAKDEQIAKLHELLEHEQVIVAQLNSKIALLEAPKEPEAPPADEPAKKKRWWSWLFEY